MILQDLLRKIVWKRAEGRGNVIEVGHPKVKKRFVIRIHGNNNIVKIGKSCKLIDTQLTIIGDNCHVFIDEEVRFYGPCRIHMETGSSLHISSLTGIRGVDFNLRGASCRIGRKCMFSNNIHVRNHDAHPLIESDGVAHNVPQDINIGNHVWLAQNCAVLKGSDIGDESVVGFGSVVTHGCPSGSVLAGNPARVVKSGVTWDFNF